MFLSTQNIQYKYAQKISALRNFGKKESGYPCFQSSLFAETPAFSETCICIVSLQSYSGQNYKFTSDAVTII